MGVPAVIANLLKALEAFLDATAIERSSQFDLLGNASPTHPWFELLIFDVFTNLVTDAGVH